tara:strand:- start:430 stop:825 length:396 start_codon:yes stop_codon:yes gene_type:complete
MPKFKKVALSFLWMIIIFFITLIFARYERDILFLIFSGVSSFFILKIIYSDHFEYVFNKRRYALSLLRFIFLGIIPLRKIFGDTKGNLLFAFIVPCIFSFFSGHYLGVLFSLLGVVSFLILFRSKMILPKK